MPSQTVAVQLGGKEAAGAAEVMMTLPLPGTLLRAFGLKPCGREVFCDARGPAH